MIDNQFGSSTCFGMGGIPWRRGCRQPFVQRQDNS